MRIAFRLPSGESAGVREMAGVPRPDDTVHLDDVAYRVISVVWFTGEQSRDADVMLYLGKQ
jgi:hypothetical protein